MNKSTNEMVAHVFDNGGVWYINLATQDEEVSEYQLFNVDHDGTYVVNYALKSIREKVKTYWTQYNCACKYSFKKMEESIIGFFWMIENFIGPEYTEHENLSKIDSLLESLLFYQGYFDSNVKVATKREKKHVAVYETGIARINIATLSDSVDSDKEINKTKTEELQILLQDVIKKVKKELNIVNIKDLYELELVNYLVNKIFKEVMGRFNLIEMQKAVCLANLEGRKNQVDPLSIVSLLWEPDKMIADTLEIECILMRSVQAASY